MRDSRLDYMRVIAILMVITVHTWSLAKVTDFHILNGVYHAFEDCGVPLFLMIAGALSLSAPCESISSFYRKRCKRVLLPFLGYSMLVYILSVILGRYEDIHTWQDAVVQYVPYLMSNRINYAYWFVPLIITLYLLTPMLKPALERIGTKGMGWLLAIWYVLLNLQVLFPSIYFLRYTSSLLLYLGYYVAGYYFYQFHNLPSQKITWVAGSLFAIGALGVILNWPTVVTWGVVERVAIFVLLLSIPARDSAAIRFLSNGSYEVYLMHFLFITPIYSLLHFCGTEAPLWQGILIPATTTLVVAGISYGVYGALGLAKQTFGHIMAKEH